MKNNELYIVLDKNNHMLGLFTHEWQAQRWVDDIHKNYSEEDVRIEKILTKDMDKYL